MNRLTGLIAAALLLIGALEFVALGAGAFDAGSATATGNGTPVAAAPASPTPTPASETPAPAVAPAVAAISADRSAATGTPVAVGALAVANGSISGTVRNALGTPIAGAFISANSDIICCIGTTSAANGTYIIATVPPGTYHLYASAPGYARIYFGNTYDYNISTVVNVQSGVVTPNIDFALEPGASISGKITNALGTPIAGAYVAASSNFICCIATSSAGDGTYTINDLSPGSYRVESQAPGYTRQYYNHVFDFGYATLITLSLPDAATGIDFELEPAGKIAGKVKNSLGTPIAGANVYAYSDICCSSGSTTSSGDGSYLLTDLAPGNYHIQASASGYAPAYYDGTYDESAATLVPATSGNTTNNIDFHLEPGGHIAGRVTNSSGTPIAGAQISANIYSCCGSGYATTAADGTYLVSDLVPGSYIVRVDALAVGYVGVYYDGTQDFSAATTVPVTIGGTANNINFQLATSSRISGRVTNALGTPIANVGLSASLDGSCCGSGYAGTDADGLYTIDGLAAGSYKVYAYPPYCQPNTSPPCVTYVAEYYDGAFDSNSATLVPTTAGNTTQNINFSLGEAGTISGQIVDPLGTPVAGAQVIGQSVICCSTSYATTDVNGAYLLVPQTLDDQIVSASVPNCTISSPPFSNTCTEYPAWFYAGTCEPLNAAQIAITDGVNTSNINITLKPRDPNCFAHAIDITSLPFVDARSTAGSTTAPDEPLACGNVGATDWYQYIAPGPPALASTVSVDTVGSAFNTAVSVYSSGISPPGVLTLVACKAAGSNSFVKFTAVPGLLYYFQVGGQNAATGALAVNVSPDTDNDGYTNIEETRLGENPNAYCNIMRADVDDDHVVSILDMAAAGQYFLQTVTPANIRFNQDGDTKIGILDLATMSTSFFKHAPDCP